MSCSADDDEDDYFTKYYVLITKNISLLPLHNTFISRLFCIFQSMFTYLMLSNVIFFQYFQASLQIKRQYFTTICSNKIISNPLSFEHLSLTHNFKLS
jgi:uncharacterized membrane protein